MFNNIDSEIFEDVLAVQKVGISLYDKYLNPNYIPPEQMEIFKAIGAAFRLFDFIKDRIQDK